MKKKTALKESKVGPLENGQKGFCNSRRKMGFQKPPADLNGFLKAREQALNEIQHSGLDPIDRISAAWLEKHGQPY